MKRIFRIGLLAVLLLAAIGFFGFAPGIAERSMNVIDGGELLEVSDEARELHASLTIVDLHGDTLLWDRDLLDDGARGHMDLPRLMRGNVALQIFSSVTKMPRGQNYESNSADTDNITPLVIGQLQPVRTWGSLLERSLFHAEKLDRAVAADEWGVLRTIRSHEDISTLVDHRSNSESWLRAPYGVKGAAHPPIGAMFSVEGLHNLEGDLANLQVLYDAGMRMAGLVHFFDNELAGSMHGVEKGGLTPMGRDAIRQMERMGIIVDIAHCSRACVADVLAMAKRPVVSSHGGVQAACEENRNLTDDEIRGVAVTAGVIGIGYWPGAVCDTSPRAIAKAMRHVRDLVGIEYVALGSDFDGAVTVRFDTSQLVQVTQALLDEGFSHEEIRLAMGGNALRVIQRGIIPLDPPMPPLPAPERSS
ncbi:dipeptidase [Paraurantiacibacter namhicola]|uniref:Membrane dipeptidase (Peptidase family M19) n=1 Tax=Paraurantiacibacter namhicola TaxID=645517 RepID=A0A1C7D5C9_9SPHN|nr:membrane dipeptidase [Paraurantiacibacter namhicola]ANU06670.1 Membrane dipeptidase (Peptidase family M19) [Paraurantiacibacter namhicola]